MEYLTIPDYKEWTPGLYLVDAGCNAGKSTFVIKELHPFAKEQHKRILMFSNRLALKGQQEILTQGTDIMLMTYQKLEFNQRQQGIEVISTYQPEDLMPLVEQFDYLVLDEAHYLFQDASFNLATETIVKMVDHYRDPAYFKARYDFRFYRSIIKKETSMIDEVEKLLEIPCLLYEKVSKDYRLTQYLESNIGKKFFKPDREVLIEVFDLKKDGHLLKSRKMLNQYLKEYGFKYHINDGKEKRKAYWVIEKSSLM